MTSYGYNEDIVVLDDDPIVERIIGSATGKNTVAYKSIRELQEQIDHLNPFAMFVDIHLGIQENGLDILPTLKIKWPFCPIIVITGDTNENSVGNALAAGADDFIYKPINTKELVARLQARLSELAKREAREVIKIGDLTIDTSHRMVASAEGENRYLSPTEMGLLSCLLDAQGTVVRRETMKRKCWGQVYVSDNALNRKLHEVRRVLKEISPCVNIRTIYGTGFVLEVKQMMAKNRDA